MYPYFTDENANTQSKVYRQPVVLPDLQQKYWDCEFSAPFMIVFEKFCVFFVFCFFNQDEERRKQMLPRPQEGYVMEEACGIFKVVG